MVLWLFLAFVWFSCLLCLCYGIVTAAGLCTGPIPVRMHYLVNLPILCNMQLDVLSDLAKAKRRWTEKKSADRHTSTRRIKTLVVQRQKRSKITSAPVQSADIHTSTRKIKTLVVHL